MNQLPKDIGGYQSIVCGPTQEGDIWVQDGKPMGFVNTDYWPCVNLANESGLQGGESIYRKMPVAKQSDCHERQWSEEASTKLSNPKDIVGSDKLPFHLWPETATALGALALLDGALKYGRTNWRDVGVKASIYFDAQRRHMNAWFEGEDIDPDSGLEHLGHALACIAILVDAKASGKLVDDRMIAGKYRAYINELTSNVKRLKEKHKDRNPKHFTIKDNKETK